MTGGAHGTEQEAQTEVNRFMTDFRGSVDREGAAK
jgi:hypothetical protein